MAGPLVSELGERLGQHLARRGPCMSASISAETSAMATPLSFRILALASSSALLTCQNTGSSIAATASIAARWPSVRAFQASRFTETMFDDQTWLVGYMYLRNSQNFPSTPELAEGRHRVDGAGPASDGTTSPQGSCTEVMPTRLNISVVVSL